MALAGLGRVNITAGGTPQALMANVPSARCQWVRIQADEDNAALLYIGLPTMVAATGVGVLGVLVIPLKTAGGLIPVFEVGARGVPGGVDLSKLYIDGATNEGCYVSFG